jgi:hypothetical protein
MIANRHHPHDSIDIPDALESQLVRFALWWAGLDPTVSGSIDPDVYDSQWDLLDPSLVVYDEIHVHDDGRVEIIVGTEDVGSRSELVNRATHWQPADHRSVDVPVQATVSVLLFDEDEGTPTAHVEFHEGEM